MILLVTYRLNPAGMKQGQFCAVCICEKHPNTSGARSDVVDFETFNKKSKYNLLVYNNTQTHT